MTTQWKNIVQTSDIQCSTWSVQFRGISWPTSPYQRRHATRVIPKYPKSNKDGRSKTTNTAIYIYVFHMILYIYTVYTYIHYIWLQCYLTSMVYGSPKLLFSCPEIPTVPDPRPLVGRPFSAAMSLHLRSPGGAGTFWPTPISWFILDPLPDIWFIFLPRYVYQLSHLVCHARAGVDKVVPSFYKLAYSLF